MKKPSKSSGEEIVKDIKRAAHKQYSAEEKIRVVLGGLCGEDNEIVVRHWSEDNARMLSCAVVKASLRASTTNGRRTSWAVEGFERAETEETPTGW